MLDFRQQRIVVRVRIVCVELHLIDGRVDRRIEDPVQILVIARQVAALTACIADGSHPIPAEVDLRLNGIAISNSRKKILGESSQIEPGAAGREAVAAKGLNSGRVRREAGDVVYVRAGRIDDAAIVQGEIRLEGRIETAVRRNGKLFQVVPDTESSADNELVPEGLRGGTPGETDLGLEVCVGIPVKTPALFDGESRQRVSAGSEQYVADVALRFGGRNEIFPAQSQVQSQTWRHLPVILGEDADGVIT